MTLMKVRTPRAKPAPGSALATALGAGAGTAGSVAVIRASPIDRGGLPSGGPGPRRALPGPRDGRARSRRAAPRQAARLPAWAAFPEGRAARRRAARTAAPGHGPRPPPGATRRAPG